MLYRARKNQKSKILKREAKNNKKWFFFFRKNKTQKDPVDAARAAFFTDGVESSDYKFNYDLED